VCGEERSPTDGGIFSTARRSKDLRPPSVLLEQSRSISSSPGGLSPLASLAFSSLLEMFPFSNPSPQFGGDFRSAAAGGGGRAGAPSSAAGGANAGAATGDASASSSRRRPPPPPHWAKEEDEDAADSSGAATVFQVAAMASCYRAAVQAWAWAPLRVLSLSLGAGALYQLVVCLSRGAPVSALLLAFLLLALSLWTIHRLSTSKRAEYESIRRNSSRLPLLAVVLGCLAASRLLSPPPPSFSARGWIVAGVASLGAVARAARWGIRLAVASLLLGLGVVGRYVGPQSFVRCSSVPLGAFG
jgi:hypothetical protein